MLNIRNIDLTKKYISTEDELKSLKSYIYQLVDELQFRVGQSPGSAQVVQQITNRMQTADLSQLYELINQLEQQIEEIDMVDMEALTNLEIEELLT